MHKTEYTDHNGNVFLADVMLPCPFCGANGELYFIGNNASPKGRKAVAKCTNKDCRCEMINATLRHNTEWVANVTLCAWNRRVGGKYAYCPLRGQKPSPLGEDFSKIYTLKTNHL